MVLAVYLTQGNLRGLVLRPFGQKSVVSANGGYGGTI